MNTISRCAFVAGAALIGLLMTGCENLSVNLPAKRESVATEARMLVYIGTYTHRDSKGIYAFELDLGSGSLTGKGLVTKSENPSFLAVHPDGNTLYAVNEIGNYEGEKAGAVSAFRIDRGTGNLELINQRSSKGGGPCHLILDASGKNVLVANYGGGSVTCLPVDAGGGLKPASSFVQHTGSSVNPRRQKGPHAHSINLAPGNRFAMAADLGLDKVMIYRFDGENGKLSANDPAFAGVAAGAGPRHFAFHPSGRFGYVINELFCTVTAFQFDARTGELVELQTISTLDVPLQKGFSTAEVQVHPSGRFLYGSNRGHDSITVFAIDSASGRLDRVQVESSGGTTPRNFGIDPTGNYLLAANQNSDNVVVYRIDPDNGRLAATGQEVSVPTPVCVKFLEL